MSWGAVRQERTALSSCEAEIRATNEAAKRTKDLLNLIDGVIINGLSLSDLSDPTKLFNDNEGTVAWAHNMTSKKVRYMSLRENAVREWVQEDKILDVCHVSGKVNPADIFTKEMKDGAHFRRLRDSFMISHKRFLDDALEALHQSRPRRDELLSSAAHFFNTVVLTSCDYLSVLRLHSDLRSSEDNFSHLSTVGRCMITQNN